MNKLVCFLTNHVLLKISFIFFPLISCSPPSPSNGANPFTSLLPLIIAICIVLIFRKKIFRKSERITQYRPTRGIEPEQNHIKTIVLYCSKCSKKYILGNDSLVMTSFGMVGSFRSASYSERDLSFVDNSKDPDLVDSINGTWNELENSTKLSQEVEINRLTSLLASGLVRWWRCQKCFKVQTYNPIK